MDSAETAYSLSNLARIFANAMREKQVPPTSVFAEYVDLTSADPTFSRKWSSEELRSARLQEYQSFDVMVPGWRYENIICLIEESSFLVNFEFLVPRQNVEDVRVAMKIRYSVSDGLISAVDTLIEPADLELLTSLFAET